MENRIGDLIASLVSGEAGRDRHEAGVALAQHLAELEREVAYTKEAFCDLIQVLQQRQLVTPDVQAILDRYDANLTRRAHIDSRVDTIVATLDNLLQQGKDIEAVRCYHTEVGAIWDRCHDVIGLWWTFGHTQKHDVVLQDMREATARQQLSQPPS
jgi:hypothetical protein